MIVKVQISFGAENKCLVYDRHRKFEYVGPADAALMELMAGRKKAFFLATLDAQRRFELQEEAQWQQW